MSFHTVYAGSIGVAVYADRSKTAIIQSVQCNGTEETIFECQSSSTRCGVYRDASVICQGLYIFVVVALLPRCCIPLIEDVQLVRIN